jgi:hypothetical protein
MLSDERLSVFNILCYLMNDPSSEAKLEAFLYLPNFQNIR